ncbi:MAG TPA: M23 family metallopeptidase [Pyrinomonadaceae bacterium]|nr:M23 family metallopeptidase [Pyrinomonadaceae bacterium]
MRTTLQKAKRIAFVIYLLALHGVVIYFVGERVLQRFTKVAPLEIAAVADPSEVKTIPTPLPVPESFAPPPDSNSNADANANVNANAAVAPVANDAAGLIIPVVGIKPDQLTDTFTDSRSEGRGHDAIDIMAPGGTPVVAATDGEIVKFFDSERGGITIYELTTDRRFMLYYAHLQRRADGISVGMQVRKGTTIGFVGDTGNAGPGNNHLHFSIAIVTDPKRFWSGTYINPYPLLKTGQYPQ